jgi:anaerobic selenocysteine-containing dehydrogenase
MLGADIVSSANRVTPIHPETRPMWVQTQVAQQLGLRDGQIVQGVAEVRDQRVRLWVKDFFLRHYVDFS